MLKTEMTSEESLNPRILITAQLSRQKIKDVTENPQQTMK